MPFRPFDLTDASLAVTAGKLTPLDLLDYSLEAIATSDHIGAFSHVDVDGAREQAARRTAELADGTQRGILHGIPFGIKSLIDVVGVESNASSAVRTGRIPDRDAAVVESLRRAGAVIVGSTHSHEFAYGLTTPTTRNPWDTRRTPGGSSGGSAAALASSQVLGALGTDTGGSIRVPAALCGVVGLKPTYGLVPRVGIASLSWSLDHVGPMARSVRDAAAILTAITGFDAGDPASVRRPSVDYSANLNSGAGGLRIGIPVNFFFDNVDPEIERAVRESADHMARHGATLVPVRIPMPEFYHPTQWGLMVPEATAYHQTQMACDAHLYGEDVRILLEAGELVPATDYIRAQRVRTLIAREWTDMFETIDVLIAPSTPATAALVGQKDFSWADGSTEAVSDAYVRFSSPANLTGRPSISVPVGTDTGSLPIGVQLIGKPFQEQVVLRAATTLEESHAELVMG